MEVLLIHKLLGLVPPEMMAAGLEIGKKLLANPEAMVPGGKSIASYSILFPCPRPIVRFWLILLTESERKDVRKNIDARSILRKGSI